MPFYVGVLFTIFGYRRAWFARCSVIKAASIVLEIIFYYYIRVIQLFSTVFHCSCLGQ